MTPLRHTWNFVKYLSSFWLVVVELVEFILLLLMIVCRLYQPVEGNAVEVEYTTALNRFKAVCEQRGITEPPTIMCRWISPTGIKTREKLGGHSIAWLNCDQLGGRFSSYPDLYADERQARAKVMEQVIAAIGSEGALATRYIFLIKYKPNKLIIY